jgi:small subunit ribosomal protein S15
MARMYSRKKGKSGSKKPVRKVKPSWQNMKPKEIEMLVLKLAKEGKTCSQIGLILRDAYGIPSVKILTGKQINAILKEKNAATEIPEDLRALIKKLINVRKHREENKQDKTALRGYLLTESKIKRLVKYYKGSGVLPEDWKYDEKSIRLYVE